MNSKEIQTSSGSSSPPPGSMRLSASLSTVSRIKAVARQASHLKKNIRGALW